MQQENNKPEPTSETSVPSDIPSDSTAATTYDSNPFTVALAGGKKLLAHNLHTTIGLVFFNILISLILAATGFAVFLSLLAFAFKTNPELQNAPVPPDTMYSFAASMNSTSIYATWGIAAILCLGLITLLVALQLKLNVASARGTTVKFGELLKGSMKRILPLLGYLGLLIIATIAVWIVVALLGKVLGAIIFVVALAVVIATIYAELRLTYTNFLIIDGQGAISAIKQSWAMTRGHMIETTGALATTALIMIVPGIIFAALERVTEGALGFITFLSLIELLVFLPLGIIATMAIAERYVQLQALRSKQASEVPLNALNYAALVGVIVAAGLLGALTPNRTQNLFPPVDTPTTPNLQSPRTSQPEDLFQDQNQDSTPTNTNDSTTTDGSDMPTNFY